MEWNSRQFFYQSVLYILLYIFIFKHIVVFETAFVFLYLFPLLRLPVYGFTKIIHLFIGFTFGLIIDFFSNTYGLHAASATLFIFLKKPILQMMFSPVLQKINFIDPPFLGGYFPFMIYVTILCFFHNSIFFLLEVFSFTNFYYTFLHTFSSTLITSLTFFILHKGFYFKNKKF